MTRKTSRWASESVKVVRRSLHWLGAILVMGVQPDVDGILGRTRREPTELHQVDTILGERLFVLAEPLIAPFGVSAAD